jgi:hypothetical protein
MCRLIVMGMKITKTIDKSVGLSLNPKPKTRKPRQKHKG